jgi:transcriptional regulator with XRE-family HTH domain
MDDQRIGRVIRALRRRLMWRQLDLARKARCSQVTISRAERGHLPAAPVLRRILGALDATLVMNVWWRAGALDRLLDEGHAALVGTVVQMLSRLGWVVRAEVTYSEFGERGSIDVLAFWPPLGILLVIEVKTDLASAEEIIRKLDEKVRLAPKVAAERLGWGVQHVAWMLVLPRSSTVRRRLDRHAAIFERVFPTRGRELRGWLRAPLGPVAGVLFVSPSQRATGRRAASARERVRTAKFVPPSQGVT